MHVEAVSQKESLLQFVLYVVLLVMINNISITLLNPFLISVNRYFKILTWRYLPAGYEGQGQGLHPLYVHYPVVHGIRTRSPTRQLSTDPRLS